MFHTQKVKSVAIWIENKRNDNPQRNKISDKASLSSNNLGVVSDTVLQASLDLRFYVLF